MSLLLTLFTLGTGLHSTSHTIQQIRIFQTPPTKDYSLSITHSFFSYLAVLSTVKFQSSTKKVYQFARENFQTRLTVKSSLTRFDSNKLHLSQFFLVLTQHHRTQHHRNQHHRTQHHRNQHHRYPTQQKQNKHASHNQT